MNDIGSNSAIWIPIIIWLLVQSFKVIFEVIKNKKIKNKKNKENGSII